jgi:hypothetical protein
MGRVRVQEVDFSKWEGPLETEVSPETLPEVVGEKIFFRDHKAFTYTRPTKGND